MPSAFSPLLSQGVRPRDPAPQSPVRSGGSHGVQARAVLSRLGAGLGAGYVFTWGFCALGMAGGVAAGVDLHVAEQAVMMLAFLLWPAAFLWAFATPAVGRVWALLLGGGVLMTLLASGVQYVVLTHG